MLERVQHSQTPGYAAHAETDLDDSWSDIFCSDSQTLPSIR